jgi:hypothetical protein
LTRIIRNSDAKNFGIFLASFFVIFKHIKEHIKLGNRIASDFTSGLIAALPVALVDQNTCLVLTQYIGARGLQGVYNSLKSHGKFHFWGSRWNHGDTLLLALCTAPIMFALGVRKDLLQPSYYNFIYRLSTVHRPSLEIASKVAYNLPLMESEISRAYKGFTSPVVGGINDLQTVDFCKILHPGDPSCLTFMAYTVLLSYKRLFSMYLSLNSVTIVIFKLQKLLKR